MASQTEGAVISDIVLKECEGTHRRSRNRLLVDANQTLVLGSICQKGVGGRMKSMAVGINEVQTITITGAPSSGTFILGIPQPDGGIVWTDPIANNANTAATQTGLDTTPFGSHIVASGTDTTAPIVFTFSGAAYAGQAWPLIRIDGSALVSAEDLTVAPTTKGGRQVAMTDEVQTATCVGTPTTGSFTLSVPHWNGTIVTTVAIPYASSGATIETAIDTAFALVTPAPEDGSISVTGTNIGTDDVVLTYDGEEYEGRDWPMATVDSTLLLATATECPVTFAETTKGGKATGGKVVGICLEAVTTTAGLTTMGTFLTRDAVVKTSGLDFHEGNKVDCIAQLRALGIVCREEPT